MEEMAISMNLGLILKALMIYTSSLALLMMTLDSVLITNSEVEE
jgi:hypothetical protein